MLGPTNQDLTVQSILWPWKEVTQMAGMMLFEASSFLPTSAFPLQSVLAYVNRMAGSETRM
jgi:hypothetical protein